MHSDITSTHRWRQLFIIVLPILVTQIALYLITFFDVLLSSQYGKNDLAGVSIGSSIWNPLYTGLSGILLSITPIVAQSIGAKRKNDVTFSVQQGFYVAFIIVLAFTALIWFCANPILNLIDLEPEVHHIALGYLRAMSFGLLPLFFYFVLRCFMDALGQTKMSMFITLIATPVNIVLNYIFIFGYFGLPAFGGIGSGIASAITYWIIALITFFLCVKHNVFEPFKIFQSVHKPQALKMKEISKIGTPIGLTLLAETGVFACVTLLMSNYSTEIIGAHQIAMNFASLAYMIPLSIAMGITILVGHEIGAGRALDAKIYTKMAIQISILFCFVTLAILISLREQIALLYSNDAEVIRWAMHFLIYAAFFQLSDAIQAPIQGALRGYKDVKITFIMALISFWLIAMPVGILLAKMTVLGPFGYWIGLITGLAVGAIALSFRLRTIQKRFS